MTRYFTLPYDSGQRGLRMGAGPLHLVQKLGVEAEEIAPASDFPAEAPSSISRQRSRSASTRSASSCTSTST